MPTGRAGFPMRLTLLDAVKGVQATASNHPVPYSLNVPALKVLALVEAMEAEEKRYAECDHEKALVRWSGIKCSYCPDCGWPLEVKG